MQFRKFQFAYKQGCEQEAPCHPFSLREETLAVTCSQPPPPAQPEPGMEVPGHTPCTLQHRSQGPRRPFPVSSCASVPASWLGPDLPGEPPILWLSWSPQAPSPSLAEAAEPITPPPCSGHRMACPPVLLGLGCSLCVVSAPVPALGHLDPARQPRMVLTAEYPARMWGTPVVMGSPPNFFLLMRPRG